MPTTPTLGQQIQDARKRRDKTLRELAREIDVAPSYLSDIENNKRNPSDEVLKKIANNLHESFEGLKKFDIRIDFKELVKQQPEAAVLFRKMMEDPSFAKRALENDSKKD
jgi:transcriptional regulator with XRE-family HTH domain